MEYNLIIIIGILLALNIYQLERLNNIKRRFLQKEKSIREEAIKQSKSVTRGQVAEQLIPILPDFKYNVSDCRFLGAPIDYIIYSGMSNARDSGEGDVTIIFAEVKQGKSQRTKIQNKIKKAVEEGRVKFETIKLDYEFNNKESHKDGADVGKGNI